MQIEENVSGVVRFLQLLSTLSTGVDTFDLLARVNGTCNWLFSYFNSVKD
jgi:hypothetical protein